MILGLGLFGMMEGVVKPDPRHWRQFPVQSTVNDPGYDLERVRVAGIGTGRKAVKIPCELVEQQDQCQRAVRCFPPVRQRAIGGL